MLPPPAGTAMSTSTALAVKATLQACLDAAPHHFILEITDVKSPLANYNPEAAVTHLNAVLQDALATVSGINEIPVEFFQVAFEAPPGLLGTHGHFICSIPEPLKVHIPNLTNKGGPLEFTGDDWNNAYKLELKAYTPKEYSAEMPREKNEKYWLHLILARGNTLKKRDLYELTKLHLSKFGMAIQDHDHAFYQKKGGSNEQGSNKWHIEYTLDDAKVPHGAGGYWDISQLQSMETDPVTHERATIWTTPANLGSVFGACDKCWKHHQVCAGHDEKKKRSLGPKRESKQTADENAKRRMAKKAEQRFAF